MRFATPCSMHKLKLVPCNVQASEFCKLMVSLQTSFIEFSSHSEQLPIRLDARSCPGGSPDRNILHPAACTPILPLAASTAAGLSASLARANYRNMEMQQYSSFTDPLTERDDTLTVIAVQYRQILTTGRV